MGANSDATVDANSKAKAAAAAEAWAVNGGIGERIDSEDVLGLVGLVRKFERVKICGVMKIGECVKQCKAGNSDHSSKTRFIT